MRFAVALLAVGALMSGCATLPLPANDAANRYVYPVLQYPHSPALGYGDAIAGGFVYRGTRIPSLQGRFVFGDITTGQLFYANLDALTAAEAAIATISRSSGCSSGSPVAAR